MFLSIKIHVLIIYDLITSVNQCLNQTFSSLAAVYLVGLHKCRDLMEFMLPYFKLQSSIINALIIGVNQCLN